MRVRLPSHISRNTSILPLLNRGISQNQKQVSLYVYHALWEYWWHQKVKVITSTCSTVYYILSLGSQDGVKSQHRCMNFVQIYFTSQLTTMNIGQSLHALLVCGLQIVLFWHTKIKIPIIFSASFCTLVQDVILLKMFQLILLLIHCLLTHVISYSTTRTALWWKTWRLALDLWLLHTCICCFAYL